MKYRITGGAIILLCSLLFILQPSTKAQETQNPTTGTVQSGEVQTFCNTHTINIHGPTEIKQNTENTFDIILQNSEGEQRTGERTNTKTTFTINHNGNSIDQIETTGGQLSYSFQNIGIYNITTELEYQGCFFQKTIIVRSYQDIFFYIGNKIEEFHSNLLKNIQQNNLLLSTAIIQPEDQTNKEAIFNTIKNHSPQIQQSKILFVNIQNFGLLFDIIKQIEEYPIDLQDKKIIIINDMQTKIAKKILAPFLHTIQTQGEKKSIHLLSLQEAKTFFLSLSISEQPNITSLTKNPAITFNKKNILYQLSFHNFIDSLIYYGVDMSVIGTILVFSLCVLLLVFLKQMIGIPGYGLYYPAFMSLLMFFLSPPLLIFFFLSALCAYIVSRYINQKVVLLVYAKIGLYLGIYILFSIILGGVYSLLGGETLHIGNIDTIVLILSYVIIALSAKKVFRDKNIISIKRRIHILWFFGLSYILYLILSHKTIMYFFLMYPRIIFFVIIGIFLVGRYSGLQVAEIIRFRPLIKNKRQHKKSL